jgi:hypothetical protein
MQSLECPSLSLQVTPAQAVTSLLEDLALTPIDLQAALDTTPRHIERWANDQAYPQTKARRHLAELMAFHDHLEAMFTGWEGARDWLRAPNRYLADLTPLEAVRAGRVDRARAALLALSANVYL